MKISTNVLAGVTGMTVLFAGNVSAHTFGAHGAGMADGLAHPFIGIDHLLAMLAVGIWAAQLGAGRCGRCRWRLFPSWRAAPGWHNWGWICRWLK